MQGGALQPFTPIHRRQNFVAMKLLTVHPRSYDYTIWDRDAQNGSVKFNFAGHGLSTGFHRKNARGSKGDRRNGERLINRAKEID
jgi:hypothetical protein